VPLDLELATGQSDRDEFFYSTDLAGDDRNRTRTSAASKRFA
jgi:hypothetical protein